MNCKRAQRNIALWVGQDLDESSEQMLQRHLACCPGCREFAQQMKSCLHMLQNPEHEPTDSCSYDLWPTVAAKLTAAEKQLAAQRFNGWLPATVMAAAVACLLLAIFWRSGSTPERSAERLTPVGPTITPVGFPADRQNPLPDRRLYGPENERVIPGGSLLWWPEERRRSETSAQRSPQNPWKDWHTGF